MKDMKKPLLEQFELDNIKLEKGGVGVKVGFTLENVIGQEHFYDKQVLVSHKIPHPDLTTKITALKPIMLNTSGRQPDIASMGDYSVTGVHLSGADEKGVIITGTFKCLNETKIAVVTPRIKLDDDYFDCEKELTDAVLEIRKEVFKYIFEDKQAQLAIEFGNDTTTK